MKGFPFKDFLKTHSLIIKIGVLTGGVIVLFQVVNLFVIYRYLKLDYDLCLAAVMFLGVGLVIARRPQKAELPVAPQEDLLGLLSSKEIQVLRLLAEGKTNKEIAAAQFIELSTVKTHVNNIYNKLSVTNRREARVKYAEMAQKLPVL